MSTALSPLLVTVTIIGAILFVILFVVLAPILCVELEDHHRFGFRFFRKVTPEERDRAIAMHTAALTARAQQVTLLDRTYHTGT